MAYLGFHLGLHRLSGGPNILPKYGVPRKLTNINKIAQKTKEFSIREKVKMVLLRHLFHISNLFLDRKFSHTL